MKSLAHWSLTKVLLVSGAWVMLCVTASAAWFFLKVLLALSTNPDVGGASVGISEAIVVPPALLVLAWLVVRQKR